MFSSFVKWHEHIDLTAICLQTVKWSSSSFWPIDETLTDTTILGHSRSNDSKGVPYILQKFQDWNITVRWFSDISRTPCR